MFKACLKKEVLEELRTKRFLRYTLLAFGMVVLTLMIIGIMSAVSKLNINLEGEEQEVVNTIMGMFDPTYQNFAMYFGTFMMTYFTIIYIVMLMSVVSKEISQNKWILPISAGIVPQTLISAKIIVKTLSIVLAEILAIIFHFLCAVLMFNPTDTFGLGSLFIVYSGIIMFTILMAVVTITINAISKRSWVSAVISICLLILGTTILESVLINTTPIIAYTPFLFYELAINPTISLNAGCYVVAVITYVLTIGGTTLWAILSTRIKPNGDK